MLRWVMVKSTSLWAGSEIQVEVCAMARGAAKARMPVKIAMRFIDRILSIFGPEAELVLRECKISRSGPTRAQGESSPARLQIISYKLDAASKVFVATNISFYSGLLGANGRFEAACLQSPDSTYR